MTTVLVTGSSGFCARYLADRLRAEGGVHAVGADCSPLGGGSGLWDDFVSVDFGEYSQVHTLLRRLKPQRIFHLVGIQRGDASAIYRANVLGTVHLLDAVRLECPDARVLLVGSAAEYGLVAPGALPVTEHTPCSPSGPYGLSKYAATLAGLDWARQFRMKVLVARPFNLLGAGIPPTLFAGALLARAREALKPGASPVVRVGNLDSQRDFVAVEDAVEAFIRMLDVDLWGEVFNVCSGRPVCVRDLAELILAHAPRPVDLLVDPDLVRSDEVSVIFGDGSKAERMLGFRPRISVEECAGRIWGGGPGPGA